MTINLGLFLMVAMNYKSKDVVHVHGRPGPVRRARAPRQEPPRVRLQAIPAESLISSNDHTSTVSVCLWATVGKQLPGTSPCKNALQTAEVSIAGAPHFPDVDVGLYGRSVTYAPDSPALPAPFR